MNKPLHFLGKLSKPSVFLVGPFALLMLGSCADLWIQNPAPVVKYGANAGVGSVGAHTVTASDTLWSISKAYRISMQDLAYANKLSAPYRLRAGQRLLLPPPQTYRVKSGDSIYTISRLFNISTTELARLNSLSAPYKLQVGQNLRLPSIPPPDADGVSSSTKRVAQTKSSSTQTATTGSAHTTNASDPHYSGGAQGASSGKSGDLKHASSNASDKSGSASAGASVLKGEKTGAVVTVGQLPTKAEAAQAGKMTGQFAWPVSGRIISTYGPKQGGVHNDGINIAAPAGTIVQASAPGTVVYADSELKGFGNLVLIRHEDRWMTAYAHLGNLNVQKGQKIARGTKLGTVGSTGSVDQPQLHFEIRRGTEALNPAVYLSK
jgi:murein DD-endopeptidase MepM/ murein hydrolase activator NlpD